MLREGPCWSERAGGEPGDHARAEEEVFLGHFALEEPERVEV